MRRVKVIVLGAMVTVAVAGAWEGNRLANNLDSYDQRYTDCMEYKKSWLPVPYRLDFTSQPYKDMAADCERRASSGGPLW